VFLPLLLWLAACSQAALVEKTGYRFGTRVAMRLAALPGRNASADLEAQFLMLAAFEAECDPRRPDSRIAVCNRTGMMPLAGGTPLETMLANALSIARASGGAFDPAILALTEAWGFSGSVVPERPPLPETLRTALDRSGYRHVSRQNSLLRLAAGVRIDPGGIAKGTAADMAIDALALLGYRHAIVDVGGGLRLLGRRPDGSPWRVALRHPRDPGRFLAKLHLGDAAVSTSGDYEKYFEYQGVRYHHLLDPATGMPARRAVAVTVVGPSAEAADAWSTALFVLGPGKGMPLLAKLPGYHALFVLEGKGGLQLLPSPDFVGYTGMTTE
jgi:thiamine biosynthesis lipoprotein